MTVGPNETLEFLELRYAGDDKLFVPVSRLDLIQKYSGGARPNLDRLGGTTWEKAKTRVKKAMRDMAEELLKLYAARKAVAGYGFASGHTLAGGVRGRVPVRPHRRSADRHRGHQARHGVVDPHGPPAVRRRGLRQDGSVDARRVQGGDGRQAGGLSRAHHRARVPARQDAARALRRLSRPHRHAQPLPLEAGAEAVARRPCRRQSRHHRRHAPPAVERRRVPRPRPAGGRRGAALRRRAQGEDQATAQEGGRPHDDRDADPADAEHVAGRHPRHVGDRNAAEGPAGHPDQRREVRPERDFARRAQRAGPRRPGVLRAQPRRVDLLDRRAAGAPGARGEDRRRPRADGGARAGEGHDRLHGAQVRHPARHHHRRERPRHSQRQHDHHQPRGPVRPVAALSAPRARRADRTGRRTRT